MELKASEPTSTSEKSISTPMLASLLGVAVHDIDYWVKAGLISPGIRKATGHGTRKLFNQDDLRRALLVARLYKASWKPRQIGKALTALEMVLKDPARLRIPLLVHEDNALLILCRKKDSELVLFDATCPGQCVMVIALETLEEETLASIARSK